MAIVNGTNGQDWLDASDGVTDDYDFIHGLDGDDTIFGRDGDDTIWGGKGADHLDGQDGRDWAMYDDSNAGVIVSLRDKFGIGGYAEGDTFDSIENLVGSTFGDALIGTEGMNSLYGGNGNDDLKGLGGADYLYGEDGDDVLEGGGSDGLGGGDYLNGGAGTDTAVYKNSTEGVHVDLYGGFGLYGEAAWDTLHSIENVTGSAHDDTLIGDNKGNELKGRQGEDNLLGFDGADTLWGDGGDDTLSGGNGLDTLWGGGDHDTLYGEGSFDTLHGGYGNDLLDGGPGKDTLYGDAGADTFVWNSATDTGLKVMTADSIRDFDAAEGDLIDLSGIDANITAGGNQAFTFIGNAAFSGAPGEVRYYHVGTATFISMQTGIEADSEGVIMLHGIHTPQASWFVL